MYDIIGDIHGHADTLEQLLKKLDYENSAGYYRHPERKVIFVGDYIDRGLQIRRTLEIVKAMVDNEQAIALMGNHEFNAILFNTKDRNGKYLRPRTSKNIEQHEKTLTELGEDSPEYLGFIEWFKTLPLFFENKEIRVVHACWDDAHIQKIRDSLVDRRITDQLLLNQYQTDPKLYEAIEETLKGKELKMPDGLSFRDKDGHTREELRIKWWIDPSNVTYRQYSFHHHNSLKDSPVPTELVRKNKPYQEHEKPVFFGHYWLPGSAEVSVFEKNVCCVDYSVAKEGKLVAYRWKGEIFLDHKNMYHV